ncbi:MAG: hypothetical protein Kow0069_33360 [Promethearchaeota archaeon]
MEQLSLMSEREIFEFANSTNIESWYPVLEPFTMPTRFVPLDREDMGSLLQAMELRTSGKTLPPDLQRARSVLEERVGAAVRSLGAAFVRLSQRSPKDSPVAMERGKAYFRSQLEEVQGDEWARNLLLVRAQKFGMKVRTGAEAVELITTSTRVLDDLRDCQRFGYDPQVIVRKWLEIPEWAEFRGFVDERKLVGLSQYFYYCNFPEIRDRRDEILERIFGFFGEVKELLPVASCVVDFALPQDEDRVIVLELNPFFVGTDACTFSWKSDKFEEFEFRYVH